MVRKNNRKKMRLVRDEDLGLVSGASKAEDTFMKLHYDAVDRGDKLTAAFFYGAIKGLNS